MTDTTNRVLPTDHAKLNAFLPAEPTDSTVATIRAAIARLDAATRIVHGELQQVDSVDRGIVTALVDAALDDDHLDVLVARLDPGNRAVLTHRLEQLQRARAVAAHRHTTAELTDPAQLAWRERCDQVRREWQTCMNAESDDDRFAALVGFVDRHTPRPQREQERRDRAADALAD